ncbi:lipoprotein signal peptidase [Gracilibacillus boraciitolerans JCM 21714]|uniref:Lipoprotein signal peptidase n=1 Tax=Gracilibacillus boraciitolerans JCM 21714 TaxID=1298598 RepID=W4VFW6_9BACI|nr:signal peptidase II [Gracilibacillus boraciitolerans]GAE91713.1 lipoprotein signal peptidase [Gracilibacillus boraciitolerans JCM 21714]
MWHVYGLALAVIIIDQITKWLIVTNMEIGERVTVIESFFYLTSHRNSGAAWGILQGQMTFFYIITLIVVGFIIFYIQKFAKENALLGTALAFVLGGAIGNFIDRLFRKEVVDFFDVYIGTYDYPIFNIADSALVVGVIIIFIYTFIEERNKKKEQAK